MLFAVSAFKGAQIQAADGRVGTAKDFLFDDGSWMIRWMVVDTGSWLPGRKVLIHASAIEPLKLQPPSDTLPMMQVRPNLTLSVRATKRQIEGSPDIREDDGLSRQVELRLCEYYGWDPRGQRGFVGLRATVTPAPGQDALHLRSAEAVIGYHLHATDGDIGHLQNFLADDANWDIRYLIVATANWWPGKHVLLAPYAVQEVDWLGRHVRLNVTRDRVKSSPPWNPVAVFDQNSERNLHRHYGWPGYGW